MKKYLKFEIDERAGYSVVDVIRTIRLLAEKSIGRMRLIKELGLNEANVKTLLKKLNENKLVIPSTKGQVLTKRGLRIAKKLNERISKFARVKIQGISSKPSVASVVKRAANKIGIGIQQRDEGIKFGVFITTFVYVNNTLKLPGMEKYRVEGIRKIKDKFKLENGDAIIVASASDYIKAERGVIAAALTLL